MPIGQSTVLAKTGTVLDVLMLEHEAVEDLAVLAVDVFDRDALGTLKRHLDLKT